MLELKVELAENGFIVLEREKTPSPGLFHPCKQYAFESAEALSTFMLNWGNANTKTQEGPSNANNI